MTSPDPWDVVAADLAAVRTQTAALLADAEGQVADLTVELDAALQQLAALRAVRPALLGTCLSWRTGDGDTSWQSALARVDALFGRVPLLRVYDSGKGMTSLMARLATLDVKGRRLVLSVKYDPAWLAVASSFADLVPASVRTLPADTVLFVNHEPNQATRGYSAADFVAGHRAAVNMLRAAQYPGKFGVCMTGDLTKLADYFPGKDYCDEVWFDAYAAHSTDTAAAVLGPNLDRVAALGVPAGIAELGCWYPGSQTAFIESCAEFLPANVPAAWFQATGNNPALRNPSWDHALTDPAAVAAWRTYVATSKRVA